MARGTNLISQKGTSGTFAGAKGIYHHLAQTLDPGLAQTAVVDYGHQNDLGDREDLPNRAMQRVGQNCRIWTVAAEAV
jgi:hypothetical protein